MFPNYSTILVIIFTIFALAAVKSQGVPAFNLSFPSSSQSASNTGSLSSASASSSAATSASSSGSSSASSSDSSVKPPAIFPPFLDPRVEPFAHVLLQLFLSSPVINSVPFQLDDPYTLFNNVGILILERGDFQDFTLAEITAEKSKDVGVITKELYFSTIAHGFAKLLYINNVLTPETLYTYPSIILRYIENNGIKHKIVDTETLLNALANGLFDFMKYIDIDETSNYILAFQLFLQEMNLLASGIEV